MVASSAIVLGLFASGDWKGLKRDMEEHALGKVFAIGTVGLIFEVSSLYSISIRTVGLPIVPVIAVFIFHDKMDGIKGMSMVLAIWGFISYVYQHYLDHRKLKIENRIGSDISEDLSPGEGNQA
ncbi:hypothetical protein QQP08_018594 [Theobroma cacao]|nr:hypothetical protein QQP08_018594 [Theobroma cacao]